LLEIRPNLRIRIEKTRKIKKMGTFSQVMNQNNNRYSFPTVFFDKTGNFVRLHTKKERIFRNY